MLAEELFRYDEIRRVLAEWGVPPLEPHAIACRGGVLKPCRGGTYRVNSQMLDDLRSCKYGVHASNLAAPIGSRLGKALGSPVYITDPVVVDELIPAARITGLRGIERKSTFHALSQRAAARIIAKKLGKRYSDCNFVIAHLGSGVSVGAHQKGRVIDVNNALDGDGPFGPERSGGLPTAQLINLCFDGSHDRESLLCTVRSKGGMFSLLGTKDGFKIQKMLQRGSPEAQVVMQAFVRQVAREIAGCAAVMSGNVDATVITGGMAKMSTIVRQIRSRVRFIAPVYVISRNLEMLALVQGGLRILKGDARPRVYPNPNRH